jgi:hypothetical protein
MLISILPQPVQVAPCWRAPSTDAQPTNHHAQGVDSTPRAAECNIAAPLSAWMRMTSATRYWSLVQSATLNARSAAPYPAEVRTSSLSSV